MNEQWRKDLDAVAHLRICNVSHCRCVMPADQDTLVLKLSTLARLGITLPGVVHDCAPGPTLEEPAITGAFR